MAREASLLRLFSGAKKRGEIAVLGRDQHRPRAGLLGDGEIALGEAEEIVGAGARRRGAIRRARPNRR